MVVVVYQTGGKSVVAVVVVVVVVVVEVVTVFLPVEFSPPRRLLGRNVGHLRAMALCR